MMMKKQLFTCIALASASITFAQEFNKAKMDSLFTALAVNKQSMSSVAIVKNGNVVYSNAIGYSYAPTKKASNTNTMYRIGSVSKVFTAVMIFQLIEKGKLALTTPLSKFYPNLPKADSITIDMLLAHRSGLHNFTDDSSYQQWQGQHKTQQQMIDIIAAAPLDFSPNTKAEYSNSNYVLLGYIVEKLFKKPYAKALQQQIVQKIGLQHTYYGHATDTAANEAFSYHMLSQWEQEPETDMSIPGGAGALVSTPTDIALFLEAVFNKKLVNEQSLELMKELRTGYGRGMFTIPFYNRTAYGHTGGIDGFNSVVSYFPKDSVAVAYCSNGMVYPMNNILIGVLSIYFNKPYKIPVFNTYTVKPEVLDRYTGTYASESLPIQITITVKSNVLMAQATGQSAFPLTAVKEDVFEYKAAGVKITFDVTEKKLILNQGGNEYTFTKE